MAVPGYASWTLAQLSVQRVVVKGALQQVDRERLMRRVKPVAQSSFFWLDLQAIRQSLEQLPWVYRVVVKRRWPHTLELQVTEQLPIARWGDQAYLNHAGALFAAGSLPDEQRRRAEQQRPLVLLAGPPDSHRLVMQQYLLIQNRLQPLDLQVAELRMNGRGGLRARLSGGAELVLGRVDIDSRLARFARLYASRLATSAKRWYRVDLRYSNGAAVAWQEPAVSRNEWEI